MRIKKHIIAGLIILMTAVQANAASDVGEFFRYIFSIPEPKPAVEKSDVHVFRELTEEITEKIVDINSQTAMLDITSNETFLSIASVLSPYDCVQQIKSRISLVQYDPTLSEMEKSVAISDIIADYKKTISDNKDTYIKKIKNLSPANKKLLAEKLALLSDDSSNYLKLGRKSAKTAKKYLAETFEGDDRAETIDEINSITGRLTQRAQALTYLTRELKSLSRQAGLNIQ